VDDWRHQEDPLARTERYRKMAVQYSDFERYDRELHDVFAVQDEVARTIVTTLAAHVNRAETERALLKPPAALARPGAPRRSPAATSSVPPTAAAQGWP
jgi:hypothetical protein